MGIRERKMYFFMAVLHIIKTRVNQNCFLILCKKFTMHLSLKIVPSVLKNKNKELRDFLCGNK